MKNAAFLCISSLLALLLATACSPHIHDTFDVDSDTGATLDAQQRVILVTHHGGSDGTRRIVCAEPSPDTMSAIAAAAPAAGGNGEVQANLSYAVSQSAASIGIRTPTIQLLRDGLYRACEGYLNGVLDKTAYEIILRNYDRIMVALLAIDAAGGFPHPPPVTISGGSVQVSDAPNAQNAPAPGGGAAAPKPSGAGTGSTTGAQTSAASGGSSSDININSPGNTVAKVDSTTGITNGDQVMKTVVDYMLDNEKWLDAVCLTTLENISKFGESGQFLPDLGATYNGLRYDAIRLLMNHCTDLLPKSNQFTGRRQYGTDVATPPKPVKASPAKTGAPPPPKNPNTAQINELQTALVVEYYYDHETPTSELDKPTLDALAKFQKAENITDEPGKIGPKTLAAIQKLRAPNPK
jgi:hypothetical protein